MYVLEGRNLTKKFKNFVAVDNLSLRISEGEILGLLGPNGAGKTTTIQMLLGILTPTSGSVSYFNKDLKSNREEILEDVGFSSTYTNLPWYLTVRENLNWVAHMYKISDRKKRVDKIIDMFKLSQVSKKIMAELSSGQLTRVNMAKAFVNFPKVLLLDEPTASLDVEIAKYIRDLILEERREFKTSVIITSHNMVEVENMCDRIIVINHGRIIADDVPRNLIKSVKTSHLELFIDKYIDKALEYCKRLNLGFRIEKKRLFIDIDADKIPEFLHYLASSKVMYQEISIDRPSLEDYFLQVIGEEKQNEDS